MPKYFLKTREDDEQKALIAWWEFACRRYGLEPFDLLHVPNERKGGVTTQAHFAALGVRHGCPDLMLTVPTLEAPGLFIELKVKGGSLSKNQKPFCERLAQRGYTVRTCYGWTAARDTITEYLAPLLQR